MSIIIKSAIADILNTSESSAIVSHVPLSITKDFSEYLSKTVEKSYYSDDAKICEFSSESKFWEQCKNVSWDLIAISNSIATNIFTIMKRNEDIPSADILFGIVEIDNVDYFYMLKFNYKSAFTHFVDFQQNKVEVSIIKNQTLFSVQAPKITEGFFVSTIVPSVKVIEQKYEIDGVKDFYISTQVLACLENISPRKKASKLIRVAEKVAELHDANKEDFNAHMSSTILDELQKEETLSVEKLGKKFFERNPIAQHDFYNMLAVEKISKEETLSLSEKFQRKFQKQAIKTLSGVEIKIPTQVYLDENEIQFINNADGTVSLLIKNVKL